MELFRLFGSILIEDQKAIKTLKDMDTRASKANKTLANFGKTALVAGAAIATGFATALVMGTRDAMEAEEKVAQLEAVLKSTAGVAGQSKESLLAFAEGLEKTTKFSAEATIEAQSLLLTFTNIAGDVFPRATQAAADMATALGTDMAGQSIALGKALNDPTQGITALTRVGVSFTEEQKNSIKAMQESGDMMGAQTLILAELERQFGGSAAAAGDTFAGKMEILKNSFGAITEELALKFMPYLIQFADWVTANMPQIQATMTTAFDTISSTITFLVDNANILIPVLAAMLGGFMAFKVMGIISALMAIYTAVTTTAAVATTGLVVASSPITGIMWIIIGVIAALIAIGVALYMNWDKIKEGAISLWNKMKETFEGIRSSVIEKVEAIKTKVSEVFNAIKDAITKPIETAKGIISKIIDSIKAFFNFQVSLPKIKLPHFKIKPAGWELGDLLKGKIPSLGIDWYAKGGIFDRPTIFPTASGFKGVGEAGPEAVTPISVLLDYVRTAVRENSNSDQVVRAIESMTQRMTGLQVVMDTGVVVGALASPMDKELSKMMDRRGR